MSTVRSHKKRRAPPPPVRIITVIDDNHDDENLEDTDKLLETTYSPQVIDTRTNDIDSSNNVYASVNKSAKEDPRDSPIIIDTVEDIKENDRYEVGESAIILSDENEEGDHIYEPIEVANAQPNVPEDVDDELVLMLRDVI